MTFGLKGGCRIALALLALSIPSRADQWEFFYPEAVQTFGCRVSPIDMNSLQGGPHEDKWQAYAWAERPAFEGDRAHWRATLADYPMNDKGYDKAIEVCRKWGKQAAKRIRKAQGIR